jgi:HEAT repeat protein
MTPTTPETLLKGALERIVYFEARSQALANDVEHAKGVAERLQAEVGAAAQREIELRRQLAELEVRLARACAEREEAARLAEALRRERTGLVAQLLDANRLEGAEGLDLAQFIAQLRSEVLGQAPPASAPRSASASPAVDFATGLRSEGRLEVSCEEVEALAASSPFPGHAEQTLFGFSVRELSAPDATARARAAERLRALGQKAAAPALATALHGESHAAAQVAMLCALASLAGPEAAPVVTPLLDSRTAEVRIAALKALLQLDPAAAGPHLVAAARDPEPAVRRRASLLALSLPRAQAGERGAEAIHDDAPQVRALGALVLGASRSESARPLLLAAMRDEDAQVRRAAGQALSTLLGQDVTQAEGLDAPTRARQVRRLAALRPLPLADRAAAAPAPRAARARVQVLEAVLSGPGPAAPSRAGAPAAAPRPASARTVEALQQRPAMAATAWTPAPTPTGDRALADALLSELRASIRGRTQEQLLEAAPASPATARQALGLLVQSGAVLRRGQKYFVA